jgi:hypothetical protein
MYGRSRSDQATTVTFLIGIGSTLKTKDIIIGFAKAGNPTFAA